MCLRRYQSAVALHLWDIGLLESEASHEPRISVIAGAMADSGEHVDKPEPRWQALLALVAIDGIYLPLPSSFIVGN